MRRLIVGIDGGGTKTNLVAVDIKTGSVVSTASSGSIHFSSMKRIFLFYRNMAVMSRSV